VWNTPNRRLRVRRAGVRAAAAEIFGTDVTDSAIAEHLRHERAAFSKLMNGHTQPSEGFIVKALDGLRRPGASRGETFEALFEIVDEQRAVAA
jgi:hypothetical protein